MTALHWDDCEVSYDDAGGPVLSLYYPGHLDPALVETFGRRHYYEYAGIESGLIERPQHVYLRKVPMGPRGDGWMRHVEQRTPGRGASPVTVFRWLSSWDMQPCEGGPSIRCTGPGAIGIPASNVSNAPEGAEYVYLCRAHHADFDRRWRAAMTAAVEAARL